MTTVNESASTVTRKILELLKDRYSGDGWVHFCELNEGTGAMGGRYIDFFAMNVWPSKKFWRVACEVKVTRADFAREMKDPTKRQPAEQYANECFFVTPAGLVGIDEVPAGWGLMEMIANGLRIKKHAQQRENDQLPIAFIASLARRTADPKPTLPKPFWLIAGKETSEEAFASLVQEVYQDKIAWAKREGIERGEKAMKEKLAQATNEAHALQRIISQNIGWQYTEPARFEAWLKQGLSYATPEQLHHLKAAHAALGRLLEGAGEANGTH